MKRSPWFETLFGSVETPSFRKNRALFEYDETSKILKSKANGKEFQVGEFEIPSNRELKSRVQQLSSENSLISDVKGISFENITGNVKTLHQDTQNKGAVFQAASQFNCLEMIGPGVSPERGITDYSKDPTQGPACALSCPAGTVFRNYFVNGTGQAGNHQIDTLSEIGTLVSNDQHKYWEMKNGYCLPCNTRTMKALGQRLEAETELYEQCYSALRIGVHWNTEVSFLSEVRSGRKSLSSSSDGQKHTVCQVYASALPVAYSKSTKSEDWAPFASLVLDAAYDSTLAAAHLLALERGTRVSVFLTALGGGAFGNRQQWIVSAIQKALEAHASAPLDVKLVHIGAIKGLFSRINANPRKRQRNRKDRGVDEDNNDEEKQEDEKQLVQSQNILHHPAEKNVMTTTLTTKYSDGKTASAEICTLC